MMQEVAKYSIAELLIPLGKEDHRMPKLIDFASDDPVMLSEGIAKT